LAFSALIALCFLHPNETAAANSRVAHEIENRGRLTKDTQSSNVVKRRTFILERPAYADARSAQIEISELREHAEVERAMPRAATAHGTPLLATLDPQKAD
jgi:hypothetical protein